MGCWGDETSEADVKDAALCECGACYIDEDGRAIEGCCYSPVDCDTCGYRPCDNSC